MRPFRLLASLSLLALTCGCAWSEPRYHVLYSPCRALATANWTARVEPAGGRRGRLVIEGDVTVPGDGYAVSLARGPVERLDGAVQQILLRTDGTGEAPPAVRHVRGEFPAQKSYSAVQLRCGDGTVAVIRNIRPAY